MGDSRRGINKPLAELRPSNEGDLMTGA